MADTMKVFPSAIAKLSEGEKKELISLMVKEIRVNHFDPEKTKCPWEQACSKRNYELGGLWLASASTQETCFKELWERVLKFASGCDWLRRRITKPNLVQNGDPNGYAPDVPPSKAIYLISIPLS